MPTGQNTAEGIPLATAPTAGNSGGTSGTALSSIAVGTASTILVQAAALIHGTRGYQFTLAGSGTDGATRILWAIAETGRLVFSFYVNISSAITVLEDLGGIRNASGNMCVIQVGPDGRLIMADAAGINIAASKVPNVFPTGVVRVDVSCAPGTTTSNGTIGYAYYLADSNTPTYSWESTAQNTGTAAITQGAIGRSTGRTGARTLNYDTTRWATTASGFMDKYVDPGGASGDVTQIGINTAEGIPINTQLTAASASLTGGASGTAASAIAVGTASTLIVSNFNTAHGSRGYNFNLAGSTGDGATRMLFPCVRSDRTVLSFYISELSALPGATEDLGGIRNSAGNMCILAIGADGKLIINDSAGAVSASRATNVFPIQTKVRVDISVRKGTGTTDGLCGYSYYLGDSDTPVFTWEDTARNTGTTDTATVFVGRSTGRANATQLYLDTIRWGYGATWFQHFVPPKTAPYADLGGDINDIEPYSVVTINCANSFDVDGTLTNYALTQISGATVTPVIGTGPTFTYKAPGDTVAASVGWQLIVTDNDGMKSAAVSATHNILPVNEMAAVGNAWVPMEMTKL